jgi:hypothetical protein
MPSALGKMTPLIASAGRSGQSGWKPQPYLVMAIRGRNRTWVLRDKPKLSRTVVLGRSYPLKCEDLAIVVCHKPQMNGKVLSLSHANARSRKPSGGFRGMVRTTDAYFCVRAVDRLAQVFSEDEILRADGRDCGNAQPVRSRAQLRAHRSGLCHPRGCQCPAADGAFHGGGPASGRPIAGQ